MTCIAEITTEVHAPPRPLTAHERLEALLAAEMNEERAELCNKDLHPGLRTLFEMNAKLFRQLAR